MRIKTYVISLKDAVDRRKTVLEELSLYPFMDPEIVDAVDGREMSESEKQTCFDIKRFSYKERHSPLPGEIGCTLSHRECYRRLLDSKEEFALIVEDDVRFLAKRETVGSIFKGIVGKIPCKPYVMTLSCHLIYYPKGEYQVGEYSFCRVFHAWGTCAYLINRKGAKVLLESGKPCCVADNYVEMGRLGIRVDGLYPMLAFGNSGIGDVSSSICDDCDMYSHVELPFYYKMKFYFFYKYQALLIRLNLLKWRKDHKKIIYPRNL